MCILAVGCLAEFSVGSMGAGLLIGAAIVYGIFLMGSRSMAAKQKERADEIVEVAKREAEAIRKAAEADATKEFLESKERFERETKATREELKEVEKRLTKREDSIDQKLDTLTTKERNIDAAEARLAKREAVLQEKEAQVDELVERQKNELLRVSGMNRDEAVQLLLRNLEQEIEHDVAKMLDRRLSDAREMAEQRAREITITAIQRYAAEHTSASTVSSVDIPSDEMKGRVIGREGRNIRAFEKATGVEVIVDDTPGVVVVSAFDPVRREVARRSLERLIQDGRIHPGRIEEIVEATNKELEKEILETGRAAALEANIGGLQKPQLELLGRLAYRTSYGQNVLRHSIEVAFLCQNMAEELKLDGRLARRCGLLHDIGKAIHHEAEGGHPQIGYEFCRKFNEAPEVLNAILGHHGDVEATSPYTPLVAAADAISASRPGSRRESLERYIKRLEQLEALAMEQMGVKQAFAIQAGREVRVIVDAKRVDDARATKIAHDIAKRIEEEMTYPGEIKVTVLREVRAVGVAK
jgi:ribonuclease Y